MYQFKIIPQFETVKITTTDLQAGGHPEEIRVRNLPNMTKQHDIPLREHIRYIRYIHIRSVDTWIYKQIDRQVDNGRNQIMIRRQTCFIQRLCQFLTLCNVYRKKNMGTGHWYNDTGVWNPKNFFKKRVSEPICPSQTQHGLT